MKSREEKLKQVQVKKQFKQQETASFVSGLPMEPGEFSDLFDFLNEKLETEGCDHSLKFTEDYLHFHGMPASEVISWLNENGAYCDYEVLGNIEEKFENL